MTKFLFSSRLNITQRVTRAFPEKQLNQKGTSASQWGPYQYEGCSNMNASGFITFFTYMLQQNGKHFYKGLYVTFKLAPDLRHIQFTSRAIAF